MVVTRALLVLMTFIGCRANPPAQTASVEEIYVDDFHSDDAMSCDPSDVPLDHRDAREFFRRARRITSRELHDHYDLAPCYVAGPVRYGDRPCAFQIRAGATGTITCDGERFEFACDTCRALFDHSR